MALAGCRKIGRKELAPRARAPRALSRATPSSASQSTPPFAKKRLSSTPTIVSRVTGETWSSGVQPSRRTVKSTRALSISAPFRSYSQASDGCHAARTCAYAGSGGGSVA
jgi:hypothetical protein